MLTRREKIGVGIAVVAIVLVASFCGPVNEICEKSAEGRAICPKYHLVPYIFLHLVNATDGHEGFVAFLTGAAVAAFTFGLVVLGFKADKHFRVTERAYVKISHLSEGRDALKWDQGGSGNVLVQIKNHGRIPATVSAFFVTAKFFKKGMEPNFPYEGSDKNISRAGAFLAPKDTVFREWEITLSADQRLLLDSGDALLIVYGYVDYRDQFGDRYRGGYARQYIPGINGNNLGFPEINARLNYDVPRSQGVGLDWDQKQ